MQAQRDALTSNAPTLHTKLISAVQKPSMQINNIPEVSNLKRSIHLIDKIIIKKTHIHTHSSLDLYLFSIHNDCKQQIAVFPFKM